MDVVARMPSLKQLRLVACASLTDAALGKLRALPALVQVDVGCNAQFTDAGIASLADMTGARFLAYRCLSAAACRPGFPLLQLSLWALGDACESMCMASILGMSALSV